MHLNIGSIRFACRRNRSGLEGVGLLISPRASHQPAGGDRVGYRFVRIYTRNPIVPTQSSSLAVAFEKQTLEWLAVQRDRDSSNIAPPFW